MEPQGTPIYRRQQGKKSQDESRGEAGRNTERSQAGSVFQGGDRSMRRTKKNEEITGDHFNYNLCRMLLVENAQLN